MWDSSKLETVPEIARRVPQGAGGDRRESAGAPSPIARPIAPDDMQASALALSSLRLWTLWEARSGELGQPL